MPAFAVNTLVINPTGRLVLVPTWQQSSASLFPLWSLKSAVIIISLTTRWKDLHKDAGDVCVDLMFTEEQTSKDQTSMLMKWLRTPRHSWTAGGQGADSAVPPTLTDGVCPRGPACCLRQHPQRTGKSFYTWCWHRRWPDWWSGWIRLWLWVHLLSRVGTKEDGNEKGVF